MPVVTSVGPQIVAALRQSSIPQLHTLEVAEDDGGTITLTGKVGSYYYKQLAQETVLGIASDREIVNNIRVEKPKPSPPDV